MGAKGACSGQPAGDRMNLGNQLLARVPISSGAPEKAKGSERRPEGGGGSPVAEGANLLLREGGAGQLERRASGLHHQRLAARAPPLAPYLLPDPVAAGADFLS